MIRNAFEESRKSPATFLFFFEVGFVRGCDSGAAMRVGT